MSNVEIEAAAEALYRIDCPSSTPDGWDLLKRNRPHLAARYRGDANAVLMAVSTARTGHVRCLYLGIGVACEHRHCAAYARWLTVRPPTERDFALHEARSATPPSGSTGPSQFGSNQAGVS